MRKYLITGAPAAGKSTFVKNHIGENDIKFDWDDLFVAVTGMPAHSEGTEGQRHVVNRLRFDLIRAAENAEGIDALWVISSKPSDAIKEAMGDYEEIHLEVDEDEAKNRAENDDNREDKEAENSKIEKYFEGEERAEKMKNKREYRSMKPLEVRADEAEKDSMIVEGFATTFNEPYVLFEDDDLIYREQVAPEAFENTDMTDVIMQYDHAGRVFARISNNTLDVEPTEKGLFIKANLGGTEIGRSLFEEIAGGYTDKMSFGFTVETDEELRSEAEDGKIDILRTITGIRKLYDVSAVSIPANDGTSIGVSTRSRIDGVIEEVRAERLEAEKLELERRRAEIRARALGGKTD